MATTWFELKKQLVNKYKIRLLIMEKKFIYNYSCLYKTKFLSVEI